jgi:hypothetical protein
MTLSSNPPIKAFVFDLSFDAVDDQPAAPSFSEDELLAAEENGRAAGFADGQQAALHSLEQQLLDQMQAFGHALSALQAVKQQQDQQLIEQTVGLTEAALKQLFPSLLQSQALAEIVQLISDSIRQQLAPDQLVVRVHPSLLQPLTYRFGDDAIRLLADDSQAVGDCHIAWPGGSLVRRSQAAFTELQQRLAHYGASLIQAPEFVEGHELDAIGDQPPADNVTFTEITPSILEIDHE